MTIHFELLSRVRPWVGRPYRLGPSDCSAFVSDVLGIPRLTSEGFRAWPLAVPPYRAGDVCWRPGHVAVLLNASIVAHMQRGGLILERFHVEQWAAIVRNYEQR